MQEHWVVVVRWFGGGGDRALHTHARHTMKTVCAHRGFIFFLRARGLCYRVYTDTSSFKLYRDVPIGVLEPHINAIADAAFRSLFQNGATPTNQDIPGCLDAQEFANALKGHVAF